MSTMTMGGCLAIAATEEHDVTAQLVVDLGLDVQTGPDATRAHHHGGTGQAGDGIDEDGSQRRNDAGEMAPSTVHASAP